MRDVDRRTQASLRHNFAAEPVRMPFLSSCSLVFEAERSPSLKTP